MKLSEGLSNGLWKGTHTVRLCVHASLGMHFFLLNHSFKQLVEMADSFRNKQGNGSLNHWLKRFIQKQINSGTKHCSFAQRCTNVLIWLCLELFSCIVVLSWMAAETDPEEKKSLNKVLIFVFFAHKKYSHSFITLWLNHWCHMDYFINVLIFLGLERGSCVAHYAGSEISWISSKIS